ncbi:MAG: CAP domain-containing protein [Patescibacteria group bacterium]|nr:MAG: CAP domain-containing protein [Patescibacteria group bacterium]
MGILAKTSALYRGVADSAHAHLVPSPRNGHVPHVLKHHVLAGYSVILILVKALVISGYVLLPAASVYSSAVTADNIVRLTNAARSALGMEDLVVDSRLSRAAAGKAEDMVINSYFAHTSPTGVTPWSWIRGQGYQYLHAGENLAVHLFSAEGVHEGWMASPSHRDNIVNGKFADIGVGVARGTYEGFDTVFVVQMFGTPKQPAPQLAAAPQPEPTPEPPAATTATVLPTAEGYKVTLAEGRVEAATAMIANQAVTMKKNADGNLEATVPVDKKTIEPEGQHVYVATTDANGAQEVSSVAIVSPNADAQQVFVPVGDIRPLKLFGVFEIRDLEDSTKRFYVVMSVLLGAILLASVVIRFEVQKHAVSLHALFVIGLSLTLAFI